MGWKISTEGDRYYGDAEAMPGAQKALHLAAAAPDLLEALVDFIKMFGADDDPRLIKLINKSRAAITKAKGNTVRDNGDLSIGTVQETDRLRAKKKQIYEDLQDAVEREWVGLTRAERFEIEKAMSKYYDYQHECKTVCLPEFAAAIEAKLKEKNT